MKYLLPLTLLASAAWAAVHDTDCRVSVPDANTPARVSRASEPPWLTGELEVEDVVAYDDSYDDDPHAGLLLDDAAEMGLCTREDADDPWVAAEDSDLDPHLGARTVAEGVEPPLAPLARSSASNGHAIAELHAQRAKLAEQLVHVRGTVVKLTEGILGETYLHLRDGTGSSAQADDDLTVTTTEPFELGETVEVEGRLRIDQDLGLGYRYPVLLAGANRVARH